MIIGISGKIKSGKNLTGQIIQYLILEYEQHGQIVNNFDINKNYNESSKWEQKAFAGKLKQIVALLTGCTVEDLESQEFKNKQLPAEWDYVCKYLNGVGNISGNFPLNINTYENDEIFKANPNRFIKHYTYRDLLQKIGTNAMRDVIHENVWVNSLMADYKSSKEFIELTDTSDNNWKLKPHPLFEPSMFPNWIITDMRFENELNAVEDRGGITIRVERKKFNDILIKRDDGIQLPNMRYQIPENDEIPKKYWGKIIESKSYQWYEKVEVKLKDEHLSETALDSVPFKYRIDNNGTIEELVEKVREILIKEKLI